jgi:glycosyltransferase involved in cell wall biosynthesis
MESVIRSYYRESDVKVLVASVDHIVCGSRAVLEMLPRIGIHVPSSVVYDFSLVTEIDGKAARDAIRSSLGWDERDFVVVSCGVVQHRKGTDLLIEAAARLVRERDEMRFLWVGGPNPTTRGFYEQRLDQIARAGLEGKFVFTGLVDDHINYLAAADVFVLPSREDPFPLVCLDAAGLGKPVICFQSAGGMPEFVEPGAGRTVPLGDVGALAGAIRHYAEDPQAAMHDGAVAAERVRTTFSADVSVTAFTEIMEEVSGLRPHGR